MESLLDKHPIKLNGEIYTLSAILRIASSVAESELGALCTSNYLRKEAQVTINNALITQLLLVPSITLLNNK